MSMKFYLLFCSVLLVSLLAQNASAGTFKPKEVFKWFSDLIQNKSNSVKIKPAANASSEDVDGKFKGEVWALLVAGSNGYDNYRHQADVCHAYQVLKSNGIPDERIIVMMYDDIANNTENPFQGQLINEPKGPNVYPGVPKDYTGEEVNPDTFLKLLQGDEELRKSGRKTLDSGPNDHVLVYFCDHGAPGLLAFPDATLGARPLNNALVQMHQQKRFAKLLFYVEACESGSMFNQLLPTNLSILAVTAANPNEPSDACFFDDDRGTFLSDVFSFAWIEDLTSMPHTKSETLDNQVARVRAHTNTSHVMSYGDKRVSHLPCKQFEADKEAHFNLNEFSDHNQLPSLESRTSRAHLLMERLRSSVPVPHVPVFLAKWRMQKHKDTPRFEEVKKKYQRLMMGRNLVDRTMFKLASRFAQTLNITTDLLLNNKTDIIAFDCYETLLEEFEGSCIRAAINAYVLRKLGLLVNACAQWNQEGASPTVLNQLIYDIQSQCTRTSNLIKLRGIH